MTQEIRDLLQSLDVEDLDGMADDASLQDAGVLNSLQLLDVITALEARYGFRIENSEVTPENLDSIRGMAGLVARKLGVVA